MRFRRPRRPTTHSCGPSSRPFLVAFTIPSRRLCLPPSTVLTSRLRRSSTARAAVTIEAWEGWAHERT